MPEFITWLLDGLDRSRSISSHTILTWDIQASPYQLSDAQVVRKASEMS